MPRVHLPDAVRDQHLHQLAGQLLPAVPEQPLSLRIHQHDPAAGIHAHHRIRRRLQQAGEPWIRSLIHNDLT